MDKKDKSKKFTSAMDDLRGLLNKEGIDISSAKENSSDNSDTPTLTSDNIEVSEITEAINSNLISEFEQSLKNNSAEKSVPDKDTSAADLPILDGTISIVDEQSSDSSDLDDYISDMEDDDFDVMEFASSVEELEEKVGAITEPEHLEEFAGNQSENTSLQQLKSNLHKNLALEIEKSIDELKSKLLASLSQEIDQFFKK